MSDCVLLVDREAVVTDDTKGTGAAKATSSSEDKATVLIAGRGRQGDRAPQDLFVAADIYAAKARAVAVPVLSDDKAEIRKLMLRDLGTQAQAANGVEAGDRLILHPIEQLVKALAAGLAVFTISLAAFIALFAWWVLVIEPSPGVKPMAHVTMPLFPEGYRSPANKSRG
jgi:hypothetical protein